MKKPKKQKPIVLTNRPPTVKELIRKFKIPKKEVEKIEKILRELKIGGK